MPKPELRYDRMVEDALRSVVGRALSHVAQHGLPDNHHFYITFRTDHDGVVMPEHLRKRFPGEMTIVLQYQFWDLEVGEEAFSVTLSFSEVPGRLTVPYGAVVAFADPAVRFGLQFDVGEGETDAAEGASGPAEAESEAASRRQTKARAKRRAAAPSDKVVPLDTFRKK